MSQPHKWFWGLIPLTLLWSGSNLALDGRIERDLAGRSAQALAGPALAGTVAAPQVAVGGRDVTLSGTIFDPAEAERLEAAAAREWGVRRVRADFALPPSARPFGWALDAQGEGPVVLTGHVPDPATRDALRAAVEAAWPGRAVEDRTSYALGAPAGFDAALVAALPAAGGLEGAAVALADGRLALSGLAPSSAAREAVLAGLGALPAGIALDAEGIEIPPPYGFEATSTGETLTLGGTIPSEDLRGEIATLAERQFAGQAVVDELSVSPAPAPEGFAEAVRAGLSALSRLGAGRFAVSDQQAELTGEALYPGAAEVVRAGLSDALPEGWGAELSEVTARPVGPALEAEACQSGVNALLGGASIYFESGSAAIDSDSAGLLDRITGTLLRCEELEIEIAGHTDSTGNAEANLALSQARAEAVLSWLAAAGLETGGYTATGYGQDLPIAPNETEEGRAQNRRIEFIVAGELPQ